MNDDLTSDICCMEAFCLCSQVVTQKKNEEAPKGALTVGLDEGFAEKKSRRVGQ